jgi:hypothetical protein
MQINASAAITTMCRAIRRIAREQSRREAEGALKIYKHALPWRARSLADEISWINTITVMHQTFLCSS